MLNSDIFSNLKKKGKYIQMKSYKGIIYSLALIYITKLFSSQKPRDNTVSKVSFPQRKTHHLIYRSYKGIF